VYLFLRWLLREKRKESNAKMANF